MRRNEITIGVLLGILMIGGGALMQQAPVIYPEDEYLIFRIGLALAGIGAAGIFIFLVWPRNRSAD